MGASKIMSLIILLAQLMPANATYKTTKYILGPGLATRDFTSDFLLSGRDYHVWTYPMLAKATQTGSATVTTTSLNGNPGTKYASICIPNPFRNMGTGTGRTFLNQGSGTVIRARLTTYANPNGLTSDTGFVSDCEESGSGEELFNNACANSGCTALYTTGTADWHGDYFLKTVFAGDPGPGIDARLSLTLEDNPAE